MGRLRNWAGLGIRYYFYLFALSFVLMFAQCYQKILEYSVSFDPPEFNFAQYISRSITSLKRLQIFMPEADLKFLY